MDKMGFPPGMAESMVSLFLSLTMVRFTNTSANTKKCTNRDSLPSPRPRRGGKNTKSNRRLKRPTLRRRRPRNLRALPLQRSKTRNPRLRQRQSPQLNQKSQRNKSDQSLRSQSQRLSWKCQRLALTTVTRRKNTLGVKASTR